MLLTLEMENTAFSTNMKTYRERVLSRLGVTKKMSTLSSTLVLRRSAESRVCLASNSLRARSKFPPGAE